MTSKRGFMTSQGRLILCLHIFRASARSIMPRRLIKKESTASGNGAVVPPIFGEPFYFLC
jgi:hypothetical protein